MPAMRRGFLAALGGLCACTAVETATLPSDRSGRGGIFITQEDLNEPYESLGLVQATRRGTLVFGFIDPAEANLAGAIADLEPEVRKRGGDGIINFRYTMTQYVTAARILGFCFFLPTEVSAMGEVVRLKRPKVAEASR